MKTDLAAKVNVLREPHKGVISLRELQAETQEELDALPTVGRSVLDGALKGEL